MNTPLVLPPLSRVARAFGDAAARYDEEALAQRQSAHALLEGAFLHGRVLDAGCGTGWMSAALHAMPDVSDVVALDIAYPMLRAPALDRPGLHRIQADAAALPLADASLDAVLSNFALQWLPSPEGFCAELARVLRPGGVYRLALPVTGTLRELDEAWRAIEGVSPVNPLLSATDWHDALLDAGLSVPRLRQFSLFQYYPDARAMLRGLKAIGAGESARKQAGLWGKGHLRALEAAMEPHRTPQGLPLRYEVLHLSGVKP